MLNKVLEVKRASYFTFRTNPPILVISAEGTVPTSGWRNAVLVPWIYIQPPADGLQDFDMAAEPPDGLALEVVTPIAAQWSGEMAGWTKGFRLHASQGALDVVFGDQAAVDDDKVLRGGDVPWPRFTAAAPA